MTRSEAALALGVIAGCAPSAAPPDRSIASSPPSVRDAQPVVPGPPASPVAGVAPQPTTQPSRGEPVTAVHVGADDALLVATEGHLVVVDAHGARREIETSDRELAFLCDDSASFYVRNTNLVGVMALSPLAEVFREPGMLGEIDSQSALSTSPYLSQCRATEIDSEMHVLVEALLAPHARALSKLPIPPSFPPFPDAHSETSGVDVTPNGHFAIVTVLARPRRATDRPARQVAASFSFDISSAPPRLVATLPGADSHEPRRAAVYVDDRRIALEGRDVVARNLATGTVTARAPDACTTQTKEGHAHDGLALSRDGTHLVATCDRDLAVLDPQTLARRYVVRDFLFPGHSGLRGTFLDDGVTVVAETSFAGEIRFDTERASFVCSDQATTQPSSGDAVPPCLPARSGLRAQVLQISPFGHWTVATSDTKTTLFAAGKPPLTVDANGQKWSLAKDEQRVAEARGSHVIVRDLATGKILNDEAF